MATRYTPQIVTDNLVFCYDTRNAKSYRGQPTTNFLPYPLNAFNGNTFTPGDYNRTVGGATYTLDTSILTPRGDYSGVLKYYTGTTDYKYFSLKAYPLDSGTYTFSYYARLESGSSNLGNSQLWRDNVTDRSVTGDWNPTFTTEWKRYSTTGPVDTVGATGNSLNYFPIHSGSITGGYTVYYWGFQLEKLSYATQFTEGTRSNTQGLVDLTRNNTFSLSAAGFDSGANLTFNGSSNYITSAGMNFQQNFSLECWAYISQDNSGLFGQGTYSGGAGLHIFWNTIGGRGMVFGMYGNDLDTTSYALTQNTWHHFVFTYNHSNYQKQFYADGILRGSNTGTVSNISSAYRFVIGSMYSDALYPLLGKIDTARMYSRILTASEVQQNFNATKSRFGL